MFNNFVKYCLTNGGVIIPLVIDGGQTSGTGLCNPSICKIGGKIKMIIRHVNYFLWKSEIEDIFNDTFGPLCYITEDSDNRLKTRNFICDLNNYNLENISEIDMSALNKEPVWDFVGLEDARLVNWDSKVYITGVRRDTTTNGQGRMELSEINKDYKEISRIRIDSPYGKDEYCEKNWMPIIDMPYHYVRWCNPLEVVKVNPNDGSCEIVIKIEYDQDIQNLVYDNMPIRGSSQVITVGEYRMAIVHRCELWSNEKKQRSQANYTENIIVWDKNWNIVRVSQPFQFADFDIEFTTGFYYENGMFYIPFALQDNIAFLLCVGENTLYNFIFKNITEDGKYELKGNQIIEFFNNTKDSYLCKNLADLYYESGQLASAMVLYHRACTYNTFSTQEECYQCMYMTGACLDKCNDRQNHAKSVWCHMIDMMPFRSEGYYLLSKYYFKKNKFVETYTFMNLAKILNNFGKLGEYLNISKYDLDILYIEGAYNTEKFLEVDDYINNLFKSNTDVIPKDKLDTIIRYKATIQANKTNKRRIL